MAGDAAPVRPGWRVADMGDVTETHHLTYRGGPMGARQLVSELESEGLTVEWSPPTERRDLGSAAEAVLVQLTVIGATGAAVAIKRAVGRFRERRQGDVDWREQDGYR